MQISVIICTYNPDLIILNQTLDHLKEQDLIKSLWELIVIDNNSPKPLQNILDLSWHPNANIIEEEKSGLTHARLAGVKNARAELIVFVDDDNLLDLDFLSETLRFHKEHPEIGSFGGKALPIFKTEPPKWFKQTGISLGCRDLGNMLQLSNYKETGFKITEYPKFAPIGTGMIIIKSVFLDYVKEANTNPKRMNLGRKGNQLTSGEDNDIILTIIKHGYEIAYNPKLLIKHLIPSNRLSLSYLKRMAYESNRSWVKVLDIHGINPWKKIPSWTLPLRKLKVYLKIKPWKSELKTISYQAALGKFKGQSEI